MEQLTEQQSRPGAYYLGDMVGTLQYKKSIEVISNLVLPEATEHYTLGYTLEEESEEHLRRLTPDTQKGRQRWKLLVVMKKVEDGVEHLKGALLNQDTNEIALLTSFQNKQYILDKGNRAIATLDPTYFVGHYRLLAPLLFWQVLKKTVCAFKISLCSRGELSPLSAQKLV